MVKRDYIMDMIDDLIKLLVKILFHKQSAEYILPEDGEYSEVDWFHIQLKELLEQGNINEAENELLERLDTLDKQYLEVAIDFYARLNRLDDDYLEEHQYSREEIQEGLNMAQKKYGISI